MLRRGMRSSSAAWGMTSKPTKRKGTIMSTALKPDRPWGKRAPGFSREPRLKAPKKSSTPTPSMASTSTVCITAAKRRPRMLSSVSRSAVAQPTPAQGAVTVQPPRVQRG